MSCLKYFILIEGMFQSAMLQSCVEIVLLQIEIESVIVESAVEVEIDGVGREAEIVTLVQRVGDAAVREELALENEKLRKNQLMRWEQTDFRLIQVRWSIIIT